MVSFGNILLQYFAIGQWAEPQTGSSAMPALGKNFWETQSLSLSLFSQNCSVLAEDQYQAAFSPVARIR